MVWVLQGDHVDPKYVPNFEQHFANLNEAYAFYKNYASLTGFPCKKNRKRGDGQDFHCSFEGKYTSKVAEDDHQTEKTSRRNGCKAMVCANTTKGSDRFFFTRIVLDHNHKVTPSPRMTKRMQAHKGMDEGTMEMVDLMHASHVPHTNVMNMLRKAVGGSENLNLTERDIQNRRAAHVRAERADDIPKLQTFFRECKANNPKFFYEFQLDERNVVKNVFWSHASQQGDYAGTSFNTSIFLLYSLSN